MSFLFRQLNHQQQTMETPFRRPAQRKKVERNLRIQVVLFWNQSEVMLECEVTLLYALFVFISHFTSCMLKIQVLPKIYQNVFRKWNDAFRKVDF